MMYWIVFAFFTTAETLTDIVLSWFPFYFELKIAFVIWLLSPYTKGSSVLYRKFVHPTLSNKEKEIDEYITQARDKSYETMMRVGKRGLNLAANAAVTAAAKGQGVLSEKLRSFSMQDLTLIRDEDALPLQRPDGVPFVFPWNPPGHHLHHQPLSNFGSFFHRKGEEATTVKFRGGIHSRKIPRE
uniref:Receptor expression-enhancing protein n=2 Tax=Homininae TaxID=207598 RepID=A0A2R9AL97_PANPA